MPGSSSASARGRHDDRSHRTFATYGGRTKETPHEGRGAQGKTLNDHGSTQKNQGRMTADPFGEIAPSQDELSVVFADELPESFTPPDEIVQDVLTSGGGSMLYGDSNSGKTFS